MAQSKRSVSRPRAVVQRAFEVWDPSLEMVVIMNAGTPLTIGGIAFKRTLDPRRPPVERVVEFESGGQVYYAEYSRLQENAEVDGGDEGAGE